MKHFYLILILFSLFISQAYAVPQIKAYVDSNNISLEESLNLIVEVSDNNGSTWQQIISYTGTNLTWTEQSFDITQYVNASTQLKIRFRITSDGNTLGQGWWVDDIKLTNYCLGLVGVHGKTSIPKTFAMAQNYPNPFNPVTVIKYQVPQPVAVSIKVFDVLGKEIAALDIFLLT